ncbi:hypothetical protein [Oceanobacillus oncorhynchi]|uniref:hypothetical protein n=1 Tax=Oceanobacillus oncorhynchi TaxID=545501 RepID=UPI001865E369|nr:hypothetical protein [Oceanobacillus oncorhynchi]
MENFKIHGKIIKKIEQYDEEAQEVLKKGIRYTEKSQLTRVKNRISRDIEKIAKEGMK